MGPFFPNISMGSFFYFTVGYDDRRMVLDGEFSYENENQRALPFSVKINEISEEMRVHTGSTSKKYLLFMFVKKH